MPRGLCITGIVIALLILLLFGLDLAAGFPFKGACKWSMDLVMIVAAILLGYTSWSALREQR